MAGFSSWLHHLPHLGRTRSYQQPTLDLFLVGWAPAPFQSMPSPPSRGKVPPAPLLWLCTSSHISQLGLLRTLPQRSCRTSRRHFERGRQGSPGNTRVEHKQSSCRALQITSSAVCVWLPFWDRSLPSSMGRKTRGPISTSQEKGKTQTLRNKTSFA